jgi:membrane protein
MIPRTARLLFAALQKYSGDSGAIYAAAIAYAALAAVFPLLLILFVLVSPLVQPPMDIEDMMSRFLNLPGIGDFLSRNVAAVYEHRTALGVTGTVGLVLGASSVFGAMESALNRVWAVKGRGWVKGRAAVFLALATFALVLLTLLVAIMFGLRSLRDSPLGASLPLPYGPSLLAVVAPPLVNLALFFMAYKFLPHTRVSARAALAGALVAMILAEIAFGALAWYLDSIADYSRIYNTAGAVFALLAWLYALAMVFLFGAEVSATYDTQFKSETR